MKIKFLAIICLGLLLSNCTFDLQMKKQDFSHFLEKKKKIVAIKIKVVHGGKKMNINPPRNWKSYCRLHFTKNGKYYTTEVYPYKTNGDYIFVNTDKYELYLTGIECNEHRSFYHRARFKKIGNKLSSFSANDKINYGGDLEIEWNPEIFKMTDLFLLGHLGINDKGSFTMRLTEDYNGYLKFMKNSYGFEEEKSVNATDKLLLKESVIKLMSESTANE